jgi:protein phosphatase
LVREQNQDSFDTRLLDERTALAVVCDGMGGAKAGNVASALAVDWFISQFLGQDKDGRTALERMTEAAGAANHEVFLRSATEPECRGMGTTLVAAYATDSRAVILNEGDSRAYYISGEGISQVTRDHSLVQHLVECGDITKEEARSHPQKNLITRALGAEAKLRADPYELPWKEGEYLLLCTDGLSNTVTEQEMLYEVLHGGDPESCCQRLLDISLQRGAPDNVTAVLIQNG